MSKKEHTESEKENGKSEDLMLQALNKAIEQGREGKGGLGTVPIDIDLVDDGRKKSRK